MDISKDRVRVRLDLIATKERGRPCYSIWKDKEVLDYVYECVIKDAVFVVDEVKRDLVRETGAKNIHAWIEGIVSKEPVIKTPDYKTVTYNPHTQDSFEADNKPLYKADKVYIQDKELWI